MDYKKKRIIVVIKAFNEYLRVKMNKKEVQNFYREVCLSYHG